MSIFLFYTNETLYKFNEQYAVSNFLSICPFMQLSAIN